MRGFCLALNRKARSLLSCSGVLVCVRLGFTPSMSMIFFCRLTLSLHNNEKTAELLKRKGPRAEWSRTQLSCKVTAWEKNTYILDYTYVLHFRMIKVVPVQYRSSSALMVRDRRSSCWAVLRCIFLASSSLLLCCVLLYLLLVVR